MVKLKNNTVVQRLIVSHIFIFIDLETENL